MAEKLVSGDRVTQNWAKAFVSLDGKGVHYLNNSTYCNLAMICLANIIEINYFIHSAGLRWPLLILEQFPDDCFDKEIDYHFLIEKLINTIIRK